MPTASPVTDAEADRLFAHLADVPVLVLAVSGGPDSTALLALAARWRKRRKRGPKLVAITVDHGLRAGTRREAAAVKRLARALGVPHRTVKWTAAKPKTALQEKARMARYGLLAKVARSVGAQHIVTAHTLDDQAETVLFRMARGSGLAGLAAMAHVSPMPAASERIVALCRPLLDIPKSRLMATLRARRIAFAEDPSNNDLKFTRVRWRTLMPDLSREGLDAARLSALAMRLRRANAAIERVVDVAARQLQAVEADGSIVIAPERFFEVPEEVALRLIGRAIAQVGDEGPVELAKLERLMAALVAAWPARFRSTLAGAMITLSRYGVTVERAPARRNSPKSPRNRSQS